MPENKKYFILVVDDSQIQRSMLRNVLTTAGFETAEATTGEEAVAYISANKPLDVLLLDVEMPGIGGFAACKQIRELPQGKTLPIMMVTGLENLESIEKAYEAGATDFTTKPINWDLIGYRVRFMVRNSILRKESGV